QLNRLQVGQNVVVQQAQAVTNAQIAAAAAQIQVHLRDVLQWRNREIGATDVLAFKQVGDGADGLALIIEFGVELKLHDDSPLSLLRRAASRATFSSARRVASSPSASRRARRRSSNWRYSALA